MAKWRRRRLIDNLGSCGKVANFKKQSYILPSIQAVNDNLEAGLEVQVLRVFEYFVIAIGL